MRTIIVGGVAGGMSAATRLRRLDEEREIVVFDRGSYVSFANCGLPYYVGGVINDRSSLLLQTPESLAARFRLDVRVRHEVVQIDGDDNRVLVRDLDKGVESWESYDSLVIASGAVTGPGSMTGSIPTHTLRSVEDVDDIVAVLDGDAQRARVVVIGGGYIGLEAVENLHRRGAHVTLVQRGPQILSPLDPEMAAPVADHLREAGIELLLDTTVTGAEGSALILSDGSTLEADLVIEASGVRPETALALSAGVALGPTGGIAVDGQQRTNRKTIYAVGDGVEKIDGLTSEPTLVTMAGLANRHGRTAADAIAGTNPAAASPAFGAGIVGILGLTVATVGWNEKRLHRIGRRHRIVHTHPGSHAGYYPGSQQMAMKLLIDPEDDRILGAQIVGRDGVDKRIDIIATAMAGGITASGLSRLELAYAPQYGSAKDPINMIGYVADNARTGDTRSVQWHEIADSLDAGSTLVDVRSASEHASGSIPGAVNVPLDDLRERHGELGSGPVVVHCQVGQRGHTAARLLTQLGYDVRNLDGGYLTWRAGARSSLDSLTQKGPA